MDPISDIVEEKVATLAGQRVGMDVDCHGVVDVSGRTYLYTTPEQLRTAANELEKAAKGVED